MRIVLPSFDPDLYLLDCQRFVHIWGMKQIPFRILLWIKYNVLVGNNQNFLFFCGVRKEHLQLFITLYCRKSQNKPEIDLYSISGIKNFEIWIHKCLYFNGRVFFREKNDFSCCADKDLFVSLAGLFSILAATCSFFVQFWHVGSGVLSEGPTSAII